jgi:polyhydroxyalkanoate synthesis regulator phasin
MADGEIDRLVDRLVRDKELTASEASKLKKEILGRTDDLKTWISDKIDQRINEVLDIMNLATKEQVVALTAKIESLTKKVERLEKSQAGKESKSKPSGPGKTKGRAS